MFDSRIFKSEIEGRNVNKINMAKDLVSQNNFQKAKQILFDVLYDEHESSGLRIEAGKELERIQEVSLKSEEKITCWQYLGELFYSTQEYWNCARYLELLKSHSTVVLQTEKQLIKSWIEIGELSKAITLAEEVCVRLIKKKIVAPVIEILTHLEEVGAKRTSLDKIKGLALLAGGQLEGIEKEFIAHIEKGDEELSIKQLSVYTAYRDALKNSDQPAHKLIKSLSTVVIEGRMLRLGACTWVEKKSYITALYEMMLLGVEKKIIARKTLLYVETVKRKEMALYILRYAEELAIAQIEKKRLEKLGKNLEGYRSFTLGADEIDLGEDLFKQASPAVKRTQDQIKRLEHQVLMAEGKGLAKERLMIIEKIVELDPDHRWASELTRSESTSSTLIPRDDITEVQKRLYSEIQRSIGYAFESQTFDNDLSRTLVKQLSLWNQSELARSGKDVLISMIMMNIYDAALWLLEEKFEEVGFSKNERDDYKVSIYTKKKEYHKAIDIIDDILSRNNLNHTELKHYLYTKAELLRASGKLVEALKYYKAVSTKDRNYRLVKLRMRQIA